MRPHLIVPLALAGALAASAVAAGADPRGAEPTARYLGVAACGACHAEALRVWQQSGHARAGAALTADERQRRACQACHATGDGPAAPAALPDVGCEACHGAGVDYASDDVMRDPALARALGLESPRGAARAAACLACHDRAATAAPFDVEAAWRRIAH